MWNTSDARLLEVVNALQAAVLLSAREELADGIARFIEVAHKMPTSLEQPHLSVLRSLVIVHVARLAARSVGPESQVRVLETLSHTIDVEVSENQRHVSRGAGGGAHAARSIVKRDATQHRVRPKDERAQSHLSAGAGGGRHGARSAVTRDTTQHRHRPTRYCSARIHQAPLQRAPAPSGRCRAKRPRYRGGTSNG